MRINLWEKPKWRNESKWAECMTNFVVCKLFGVYQIFYRSDISKRNSWCTELILQIYLPFDRESITICKLLVFNIFFLSSATWKLWWADPPYKEIYNIITSWKKTTKNSEGWSNCSTKKKKKKKSSKKTFNNHTIVGNCGY